MIGEEAEDARIVDTQSEEGITDATPVGFAETNQPNKDNEQMDVEGGYSIPE